MSNTDNGTKIYTPLTLKLYDWWVLCISNSYAWNCSTKDILIPYFLQNLSPNHLDIGVGTGYYLTKIPAHYNISLMDLNPASLKAASARVGEDRIHYKVRHDVFESYPEELHGKFDSISMYYLIHCLPGTMEDKRIVIKNAKAALTKGGILYGATILGDKVRNNSFALKLLQIYNKKGIFSNFSDSEEELKKMLSHYFKNIDVIVKGAVAMFSAHEKK
ncbi:TPA: class I SAM-dependent methyltransferase [Klebsiella pneumoniae]|nr:class I SAM-dependent methyltransferase [Klebsiella pneumoniae]